MELRDLAWAKAAEEHARRARAGGGGRLRVARPEETARVAYPGPHCVDRADRRESA
ncbi:hypothetical protein [Actinokineospora inagensis]|uniref:hypothetical protein n=1 Tax=Actinokineospora inagensis TaxID=103730 RepID=UPI0012FCBE50|nr:hypothetical protein [Actinokineospora inagensis]